ncbi:MAG: hypothetical protein AB8B51_05940 [Sedimentitalea sp.]
MQADPLNLNDTLKDVFSLVPTDDSLSSCREVIEQYGDGNASIKREIIWTEFTTNMQFLRAGVSHAGSMENVSILSPKDHPDVAEIVDFAKLNGLSAGMLVASAHHDGFHWCFPYTAMSKDRVVNGTLRTVLVTQELFFEIFDLFNRHSQLTPSEKLYIFQLVSGLTPADAAKRDDLSVETKRSHLKRAMSKLECSSQSEIMRLMISQMIHIMYLCEQDSAQSKAVEDFTNDHLCAPLRLTTQRLPNGRLLRIWELGPPQGKPLLMLHGYLFPFLMLNAKGALERLNWRLLIPIRGGYLDENQQESSYHDGSLVKRTLEDLHAFIRMTWAGPIDVLCHATGAYFAMLIEQKSPGTFRRMVVTSLNLVNDRPSDNSPTKNFLWGLRNLGKHTGMYKVLVNQFKKRAFSNDRTTKYVLRRLFQDSPTDVEALNGQVGNGAAFDWYRALHSHSPIGIASDFALLHDDVAKTLGEIETPMVFLHGPTDGLTSTEEMTAYVAGGKTAKLHVLDAGGHLAVASHPDLFWRAIEDGFK